MKLLIASAAAAALFTVSGCDDLGQEVLAEVGADLALQSECESRVSRTTNSYNVSAIRTEQTSGGHVTYVRVPGAAAPWACYSTGGNIWKVEYSGSEGFY